METSPPTATPATPPDTSRVPPGRFGLGDQPFELGRELRIAVERLLQGKLKLLACTRWDRRRVRVG
jgi:hypothetical protein